MLTDLVIVDDFFDNVSEVLDMAHNSKYYTLDEHPETASSRSHWIGNRTELLHYVDPLFFNTTMNNIIYKTVAKTFGNTPNLLYDFTYTSSLYFHYLTEKDNENKTGDNWLHKDSINSIYAGVVYLNPDPPENTGTTVFLKDVDRVDVENKFNRLVMYNANYLHSVQNCFGTDVKDSRLTLTFFFNTINFQFHNAK